MFGVSPALCRLGLRLCNDNLELTANWLGELTMDQKKAFQNGMNLGDAGASRRR